MERWESKCNVRFYGCIGDTSGWTSRETFDKHLATWHAFIMLSMLHKWFLEQYFYLIINSKLRWLSTIFLCWSLSWKSRIQVLHWYYNSSALSSNHTFSSLHCQYHSSVIVVYSRSRIVLISFQHVFVATSYIPGISVL